MTCRTSMAGCEETLHYSPKKRFMNRRLSLRFHPPKAWGVSQVLANNPTQKATDEAIGRVDAVLSKKEADLMEV